ncbi:MAG: hypothetical protein R6T98_08305 [Desulfatiglandales bacterium]
MRIQIQNKNGFKIVNLNRRRAIREKCLNCSAWSIKEVEDCQHTDCPLYPYRSGKGPQNAKARGKAIRDYCLWCMNGNASEVRKCPTRDCPLFPYRQSKVDTTIEIMPTGAKKGHIEALPELKKIGAIG